MKKADKRELAFKMQREINIVLKYYKVKLNKEVISTMVNGLVNLVIKQTQKRKKGLV